MSNPTETLRTGRAAALPPDERRAAIVRATTPLLREYGPEVTTRQIADAAGIAEGTIFRVFDCKDDLIDAVIDTVLDVTGTATRIRALDRSALLDDRLRMCAELLGERHTSVMDIMIALHKRRASESGDDNHTERARAHRQRQQAGHAEIVAAIAELLEPDAESLSCSPKRAAHLLRLMSFAGTHTMINGGDPLDSDEIASVLLHGIIRPESRNN